MRDFIIARLNKDNFWNLMFFLIFFTGLSLNSVIIQPLGGIIFWISLPCAIILTKGNSNITFNKEKINFTTNQGAKIQKAGVAYIWLLFVSFFLSSIITPLISKEINLVLFFFIFTLLPSLYCVLRNFPISVYFQKEAWYIDKNNSSSLSCSRNHKNWLWYSVWNKR